MLLCASYDPNGVEVWTRQFGTAAFDLASGVAVDDDGNVYVVGRTESVLSGQTSTGGSDAFIRKYNSVGMEVWTRQFGASFIVSAM